MGVAGASYSEIKAADCFTRLPLFPTLPAPCPVCPPPGALAWTEPKLLIFFLFFSYRLFFFFAALGLSCSTQESLVPACELLAAACGI